MTDIVRRKRYGVLGSEKDYFEHPEQYYGGFFKEYLDLVTFVISGIYWESKYHRLLTK